MFGCAGLNELRKEPCHICCLVCALVKLVLVVFVVTSLH